jgi:hypothetical protein
MRRRVAGAVVVLVAGLGCSACGYGSPRAATPPSVVTASGTGNKTLGTFTVRGTLSISMACTGKGYVSVLALTSRANEGIGTFCPSPPGPGGLSSGMGKRRARIKVHAPARVRWTVVVRDSSTSARR